MNTKRYFNRAELIDWKSGHGRSTIVDPYDDDQIVELDFQDGGNTVKLFKMGSKYARFQLMGDNKCMLGDRWIEFPLYKIPEVFYGYQEIEKINEDYTFYVPVGSDLFVPAKLHDYVDTPEIPTGSIRVISNVEHHPKQ